MVDEPNFQSNFINLKALKRGEKDRCRKQIDERRTINLGLKMEIESRVYIKDGCREKIEVEIERSMENAEKNQHWERTRRSIHNPDIDGGFSTERREPDVL